jgi:hypothetical protein
MQDHMGEHLGCQEAEGGRGLVVVFIGRNGRAGRGVWAGIGLGSPTAG